MISRLSKYCKRGLGTFNNIEIYYSDLLVLISNTLPEVCKGDLIILPSSISGYPF